MTTGAIAPLSNGGTRNFAYIYTVDDERIALVEKLSSSATTTNWTLRGLDNHLLRTWTNSSTTGWSWREDDIWRGAALLAYESPAGVRHYGLDHLGSPAILTDATAHPIGTITFDAFGNGGATGAGMLQYTGHERDSANAGPSPGSVNLPDYLHARYYSATVGRFLSVDPVLGKPDDPQTWNRYAYVGNNPITYNDPNGEERPFNPNHFDWSGFNRDVTAALKFLSTPQGKALAIQAVLAVVVHSVTPAATPMPAPEAPLPSASLQPEVLSNGGLPTTLRYTQPGETFIRYESGNPAFSRISADGVTPGTYAAPASDGFIPVSGRAGAYNLPNPEIPRTQAFQLEPVAGTSIIGPRPVVGGTGSEVIFPAGAQCTVTTLGSQ